MGPRRSVKVRHVCVSRDAIRIYGGLSISPSCPRARRKRTDHRTSSRILSPCKFPSMLEIAPMTMPQIAEGCGGPDHLWTGASSISTGREEFGEVLTVDEAVELWRKMTPGVSVQCRCIAQLKCPYMIAFPAGRTVFRRGDDNAVGPTQNAYRSARIKGGKETV